MAFAEIRFTENKPVRFLLARTPGNQDTELAPGEFVGYGVDSGTGCFADARMAEYQQSLEEEEQEAFIDELTDLLMESDPGAYSALDYSPEGAPANLVALSSGEGDGGYGSYWGFDENGVLCCLLTDFGSFYLTD